MSSYLLVVGNDLSLTAQDIWIQNRLAGQGHTVTVIDDGAAAPVALNTTHHAVILSNTANINQITTKYNATTRGVLSFRPYPHSLFTSQVSPSNGTSTTTQYVTGTLGDAIVPTGSGTNVTYLTSGAIHTYVDTATLGAGVTRFLAARNDLLTRVTGARYDTGTVLSDGSTVAPSRRVRMGFEDLTLLDSTGQSWFDNAVTWVTTALDNQAPTANAGPDQAVGAGVVVTLDGTGSTDSDGTVTGYQWTQLSGTSVTLSSATVAQPTFTAPAALNGSTLSFGLVVTDNQSATSAQDTVTITVAPAAQLNVRVGGAWEAKPLKVRQGAAWVQ